MQAIIDIGSTSVRLCFCDLEKAVNEKQVETTRLAENQTADGELWRPALIRTAEAVEKFVSVARISGFEPEIFATEAVRSASNRDEFLKAVFEKTGKKITVVEKEDEAKLAFFGVYNSAAGRVGIVDMGGGSTELCVGDEKGVLYAHSLSEGAVRLTNRERAGENVKKHLSEAVKEYGAVPDFSELIAVGGTACTVAAVLENMKTYDPRKIQGRRVSRAEIQALYDRIKNMSEEERKKICGMPEKRAGIIHNGLLFYLEILDYLKKDAFTVSDRDNVEGFAIYLQNGKKWPNLV